MKLKLGIFSDLHVRMNNWQYARRIINEMMEFFKSRQVNALIDLGDRIEGSSCSEDLETTDVVRKEIEQYNIKVFYLYGNHDLLYAPKSGLNDILKKQNSYDIYQFKGVILMFLDSNDGKQAFISEKQIEWMSDILKENNNQILIFSHHPIFELDISSHPYFSIHQDEAIVKNFRKVQEYIIKDPNILGVFQGHIHRVTNKYISDIFFGIIPPLRYSVDVNYPLGGVAIIDFCFPDNNKITYFQVNQKENKYIFLEKEELKFKKVSN